MRKKRNIKKNILYIIVFILLSIYFYKYAANIYTSKSILTLKQIENQQVNNNLLNIISNTTNTSKEDSLFIKEYIYSYDLFKQIKNEIDLEAIYKKSGEDFLYNRYDLFATEEDLYEYYKKMNIIKYNEVNNLLTLEVKTFYNKDSLLLNKIIIEKIEKFVNNMYEKINKEKLKYIKDDLNLTELRYALAKKRLLDFQTKNEIIDPNFTTNKTQEYIIQLEKTLFEKESDYKIKQSYMQDSNIEIKQISNEIKILKEKIEEEKKQINQTESKDLKELNLEYKDLMIEMQISEEMYKIALSSYENIKKEIIKENKKIIMIQEPNKPEKSSYPNRIFMILTCFFVFVIILNMLIMIKKINEDK